MSDGHPLAVGQPAAGQHVEAEVAVVGPRRPQPDVVDLRLGAVLQATGDADLELAGQVGVSRLPVKKLEMARATGRASKTSSASTPDTGQHSTLRAESPQAWTVVSPTSAKRSQIRGHVADAEPVDLDVCRVVMSA